MRSKAIMSGLIVAAVGVGFGFALQGKGEIAVVPAVMDVGVSESGSEKVVAVSVTNRASVPHDLLGAATSCSCVVMDSLPLTVPAGETVELSIRVDFRGDPGTAFSHAIMLFTDSATSPQVKLDVFGRVSEEQGESAAATIVEEL